MATLGLGGPVGVSFATVGFSSAVLVARVWEYISLESYLSCGSSCPIRSSDAFQLHHFYYGLVLILIAMGFLVVTRRRRARWDAALIFGIGSGLSTDEAGLLLTRIPYNDPLSILSLACVGVAFFVGTIDAAVRDGTREFKLLDRADILTELSILLVMAGFLYLDRPLITIVEVAGGASWACAVLLFTLFGKKHFIRIWTGPG
ncbi:hypothetical protein E6H27_04965 [Candidatus Bathyarchaeota archaeon]|nr:MAG: hypothetical protein E6H27_04965 [Candidatus Bathyarchaeota archaeon]